MNFQLSSLSLSVQQAGKGKGEVGSSWETIKREKCRVYEKATNLFRKTEYTEPEVQGHHIHLFSPRRHGWFNFVTYVKRGKGLFLRTSGNVLFYLVFFEVAYRLTTRKTFTRATYLRLLRFETESFRLSCSKYVLISHDRHREICVSLLPGSCICR
jgi:hypothetical protein